MVVIVAARRSNALLRKDVVFGPSSAKTGAARRYGGKRTAAVLTDGHGYPRVSIARRARSAKAKRLP